MWATLIKTISKVMHDRSKRKKIQKEADDKALLIGPSWRYRRRLIYGAYIIGMAMIIFGGFTVFMQSQIGVEMIIGGVALVSIIITAYTTSATYEDVKVWTDQPRIRFGESGKTNHELDTDNPDGL